MDSTCSALPPITDREFSDLSRLFYDKIGISFGPQKRVLVASRLSRRLRQLSLSSYSEYFDLLMRGEDRENELREAINCVTTNKTDFFREEQHFEFLRKFLAGQKGSSDSIRIWCAASSTGEEPYTLAMSLFEEFGAGASRAEILASDIDTNVLQQAARGVYMEDRITGLSPALRQKYFLKGTGNYSGQAQIKPALRKIVTYRRINLVGDDWQVRVGLDAIFCRNVMIYFDRTVQETLIRRLLKHLRPGGLLFVGRSESLYWLSSILKQISQGIYVGREGGA